MYIFIFKAAADSIIYRRPFQKKYGYRGRKTIPGKCGSTEAKNAGKNLRFLHIIKYISLVGKNQK